MRQAEIKRAKGKPGEEFGYLRRQYGIRRQEAETDLLIAGVNIDSPEFRKARKLIAKRLMSRDVASSTDELTLKCRWV